MLHGCGRRYLGCGDSSYSDLGQVWSAGCGFGRGVRGLPAQHILGLLARLKDPVPQTDRTFLVRGAGIIGVLEAGVLERLELVDRGVHVDGLKTPMWLSNFKSATLSPVTRSNSRPSTPRMMSLSACSRIWVT